MSESQKTYSRRQLISVAEVANAFALSRDIAGLEAIQQLAECVLQGKLCADLYPPHQYWQHGGQSDLIGKPAQNSVQVWRSLAAKSVERHMSDKDDFNYPPSASTYHLLADDVFAFARTGGLSARAAEAMHDLSVRHKAELATPTAIEPQTQFAPSHQAAAPLVAESASSAQSRTRRDLITPAIEAAQKECENQFDAPAVWVALVQMAQTQKHRLLGVSEDGIKWLDTNDEPQFLKLKDLRDRLRRKKKKAL